MTVYGKLIRYIWQLPQNTIGFLLTRFLRRKTKLEWETRRNFGVALGEYIIVNENASVVTRMHEYGHVLQSRKLGPLYLVVVGIPSITMAALTLAGVLRSDRYYDRWPENWADRLGGVDRNGGAR